VGGEGGNGMSYNTLKLMSEVYRNVAQAPTQTNLKGQILTDLEEMMAKEITEIKYPVRTQEPIKPTKHYDFDEIPF
jgi:hypothetical protein